jgi:AcrR family transcriptional regulator
MESRRDSILDAALRSFAERGVSATTVEHIRSLSGASVGSIYHHFGHKEGIAAALYVHALRSYQEGFAAVIEDAPDAERGVKRLVRHHLRWVAANPELARYLLAGAPPGAAAAVDGLNRELFSLTGRWVSGHVRAGALRRLPRGPFYAVLVGPAQEFCRQWLAGRSPGSMRSAERVLPRAAWDSLAGPVLRGRGPGASPRR